MRTRSSLVVVGGGPAGLRAAEVASAAGTPVAVLDAMPSVGRKFLVAGRGGLNITNTDPDLRTKYSRPKADIWDSLLKEFSSTDLRAWVEGFGITTFSVSSGRVYPREMKSAPLLRRWVTRLRELGVEFFLRHRWCSLEANPMGGWRIGASTPDGPVSFDADAVVLALGGGSWPVTGSDGAWQSTLADLQISQSPLVPANCGWETDWPEEVLASACGQPLKNIRARAGGHSVVGELLVTRYGLEGGAIYSLTPALRECPLLSIDFKPSLSRDALLARLPHTKSFHLHEAFARCHIQPAAQVLMRSRSREWTSREAFVSGVKEFSLRLSGPRPLAEAISSAGGVYWDELDENLMLRRFPGVYLAGEMIDWEAPTGGYLMQGCFATGSRSGRCAAGFAAARSQGRPGANGLAGAAAT